MKLNTMEHIRHFLSKMHTKNQIKEAKKKETNIKKMTLVADNKITLYMETGEQKNTEIEKFDNQNDDTKYDNNCQFSTQIPSDDDPFPPSNPLL